MWQPRYKSQLGLNNFTMPGCWILAKNGRSCGKKPGPGYPLMTRRWHKKPFSLDSVSQGLFRITTLVVW